MSTAALIRRLGALVYQQRIARIRDQSSAFLRNPDAPFGRRQQHHSAVRGDTPAVERSGYFLARYGWKTE